jgi:hypothetical protein
MVQYLTDYQGCQIRLTEERWEHILSRAEMAGMEQAIAETLINPEIVRRSRTDNAAYLYYRYRENTLVGDKWLCVVVKYLEDDAFIITAYLTDQLKQGEQLWQRT